MLVRQVDTAVEPAKLLLGEEVTCFPNYKLSLVVAWDPLPEPAEDAKDNFKEPSKKASEGTTASIASSKLC